MREDDVDAAGVLAAAAACGASMVAAPVALALAILLPLLAVARHRRVLALTAACLFAIASARAEAVASGHAAARSRMLADVGDGGAFPASCELVGEVLDSPTLRGDAVRLDLSTSTITCGPHRVRGRGRPAVLRPPLVVRLHVPKGGTNGAAEVAEDALRGDRLSARATLAPVHAFTNLDLEAAPPRSALRGLLLAGTSDELHRLERGHGLGSLVDRVRSHLRARIRATFPEETEAMARALILGEDDVEDEDRLAFQRSGLSHLLAVSGMHLVLVVAGAVAALRAVLVRVPFVAVRVEPARVGAVLGIPLAFLYADLAGGSGSARRAAWMLAAALGARALARPPAPARALGLSALAMIATEPLAPFDVSFVLSVCATCGLVLLARPFEHAVGRLLGGHAPALARALGTTAAATVACVPVLAALGPDVSLVSIFANVVAVPLGEAMALPLCLVHAVLSPAPAVERGAALAASGALLGVRTIARVSASLPWGAFPVPRPSDAMLIASVFGAGVLTAWPRTRTRFFALAGAAVLVLLELWAIHEGRPRGLLAVTFLDVGQGDAALVDLPDGSAMLVDGGGLVGSPLDVGERVVAPMLRARRRSALRAVVVSHPHPDHFGGLEAGLLRTAVDEVWDTGQADAEERPAAYRTWIASRVTRGARVRGPLSLCGRHELGGAVVEVLAPCPGADLDHGPNDNSFVLRFVHGRRAILLVGDAERALEETLGDRARRGEIVLRSDVLKVGHHGSRTSSTERFVRAVAPRVAVVSSGVRNRFGHPHGETLVTLGREGAALLRTDRDGAVRVWTDGERLDVETAGKGRVSL